MSCCLSCIKAVSKLARDLQQSLNIYKSIYEEIS